MFVQITTGDNWYLLEWKMVQVQITTLLCKSNYEAFYPEHHGCSALKVCVYV